MQKNENICIFEDTYLNESANSNDLLTLPASLITCTKDTIFSRWQITERQFKQVDFEQDPETYFALEKQSEFLFNIWLQFEVF
jgi:hypothetical protein